jgi:hypothetical protein
VFKKSDDDLESHIAEGSSSNFEQVMPKTIPELADGNKVTYLIVLGNSSFFIEFYLCFTTQSHPLFHFSCYCSQK